jgi:hypothetical protein
MCIYQWLLHKHVVGTKFGFIAFSLETKHLFGHHLNVYSWQQSTSATLLHDDPKQVNFLTFTDKQSES